MSRYLRTRRTLTCLVTLAGLLLASACTEDPPTPNQPDQPAVEGPVTSLPEAATSVVGGADAVQLAVAASAALFASSPVVLVAAEDDEPGLTEAATRAADLGVPLLLTAAGTTGPGEATQAEISRLGAQQVIAVGAASAAAPPSGPAATPADDAAPAADTPVAVRRGESLDELLVLALDQPVSRAAVATARAAGARVLLLPDPDPRTNADVITALAGQPVDRVLALGDAFGPDDRLRQRVATAATGVLLPGGGQVLFPGRRMVALYGHPGSRVLGSLGEQPVEAAIARAKSVAASYQPLVGEPVVPAFEIIATVASAGAGEDGDYSRESSIEHLKPWVDAAGAAGVYVVLDLQPGHTDFLTQAKRYEELLKQPHVGLALDPEWRLAPGQVHMRQIGSVSSAEVNATAAWLAELTRTHTLPQKVLMVHQFRLDMITNRAALDTSHDELKIIIHADGFGSTGAKFNTWRALHANEPPNVWWGWKNFYDEDRPTFTPGQTVAVSPSPVFISYQ
jgi:hypothetical protein